MSAAGIEALNELRTQVAVLGAGPGGYSAAFRAADLGKKVTLIERYPTLGGVCLNVGCIPSKALLHVARVIAEIRDFKDHGIDLGEHRPDPRAVRAWTEKVVGRLTGGLALVAKQRKVQVVQGTGTFAGPNSLAVQTGNGPVTVHFEHAIIAAGSQAGTIPGLPVDPRIMDSTDALLLSAIPPRLLVIGGGIIGLEMATVYEALGSRVTVVEMLDQLMNGCDADIVRPLQRKCEKRYAGIHLNTKVAAIEARPEALIARFEGPQAPPDAEFDAVLVAVGRRPNGRAIGAERAGIRVSDAGFTPADEQQRTSVPHIFAIGDICGDPMLAHRASAQGKVAAEVIAGMKTNFLDRVVPSVAYTDPEVAWVGVTETEAKARGLRYGKGVFPWAASGRSLALGRDEGMTKLLFDADTHRIIGMAAVGPQAGDLIAEGALAIEMGADAEDIGLTIHPHPTLSETVMMAAEMVTGTITDLYVPKR